MDRIHSRAGEEGRDRVCPSSGCLGAGLGYGGRAGIVGYVFQTTDINRLEAYTYPANVASVRVLEKAGFRHGLMREWGYWRGEFHDMQMNALLRKDAFESHSGPDPYRSS